MKNYSLFFAAILLFSFPCTEHALFDFLSGKNQKIEKQINEVKEIIEKNDTQYLKNYLEAHAQDKNEIKKATYDAAFLESVKKNSIELAQEALEYCDINAIDKKEGTALHIATKNDSIEMVEFLTKNEKDIHYQKDNKDKTPADYAKNNPKIAFLLKEHIVAQTQKREKQHELQIKKIEELFKSKENQLKKYEEEETYHKAIIAKLYDRNEALKKEQEKYQEELKIVRDHKKVLQANEDLEIKRKNLAEKIELYNKELERLSIIKEELTKKQAAIKEDDNTVELESNELDNKIKQKKEKEAELNKLSKALAEYEYRITCRAEQIKKAAEETKNDSEKIMKSTDIIKERTNNNR